MRIPLRVLRLLLLTLLAAAGCDPQAGESYEGDPLFKLTGSVIANNVDLRGDATVAIMWMGINGETRALTVAPVSVRGDFPAKFTITAFEPPPQIVRSSLSSLGAPAATAAIGMIVAVDRESPAFYPTVLTVPAIVGVPAAPLPQAGPGETFREWDLAFFRGAAPDHLIVYRDGEVPAQARCLARYQQGYNLIEVRSRTTQEQLENEACVERGVPEVLAAFNAEHGTSHTPEDWRGGTDWMPISAARRLKACELGCEVFSGNVRGLAQNEPVTLQMGPAVLWPRVFWQSW